MNNYCKFYGKTFIVTIAMSNNILFCCLANQIHGHIHVIKEFLFYSMETYMILIY